MVYTLIKVNITRACTHAGSHSRCVCVCGLPAVLITAVCQAEQGQQIWNMCYVTPLSKEGGSDPALGRTGPFKTDERRRQKFCEITSISQIDVCRFHCQGANTSELQRTSDPHFPISSLSFGHQTLIVTYLLIGVEIEGGAVVAHGPKITLITINNSA